MTTISIPANTVIMIVAGRDHDRAMELCSLLDMAHPEPWSVNDPEDSTRRLKEALAEHDVIRVFIRNSHAKARTDIARMAARHGHASVCLRLPDGPAVDAKAEGIDAVHEVSTIDGLTFAFTPMPTDRRDITTADIIGDVHGCADELTELLENLGHMVDGVVVAHPEGRTPILLGDLTDRGPANLRTLRIAESLLEAGGLMVLGNHCDKLVRWLSGSNVKIAAGLAGTVEELQVLPEDERRRLGAWLGGQQTHYVLDGGRLVVAHAGLEEALHGRSSQGARSFALYGKPIKGGTELDEEGYPKAEDWALSYSGDAHVVHGHVVHPEPRLVNRVWAIDQGCVFGGSLTALRWPSQEVVQVKARATYFEPRGRNMGQTEDHS